MTLGFYAPPSSPTLTATVADPEEADWKHHDARFKRSLPTEWLAKRTAYRALVLGNSETLKWFDGLRIGTKQRANARAMLENYGGMTM